MSPVSTLGGYRRGDWVLALLLFAGIVAYLSHLPRNLGVADESHFLYEAKRIRDGEVMYRDFFQFVTPGASYAMAFLFWAFGTTMTTARVGTAVVHGVTGVLMYATCRALHVRRALAAVAPLAYLAMCQSAWQVASWHWFGTLIVTLLVFVLVRGPWASRPRWAIVPGLATGCLIAVEQQRGLPTAVGVGLLFVVDHLLDRRYPGPASWQSLAARLSYFFAGIAAIVIPLLATFVMLAGFDPLFNDLVRFPLQNYAKMFRCRWGTVLPITTGLAAYTFPTVLKYLPVALLPACLRVAFGLYLGLDRARLRALVVLIVSAGFAALSIRYFPDFIHIAFVAPIFLVAAAEALEWTLTALVRPAPVGTAVGWVVAVALIAVLTVHLRRNALLLREEFPFSHETAFGRIDFSDPSEPPLIDAARTLLSETPSRELFAYANTSKPYLTTGGKNPTPYQYFFAPVSGRQQTDEVLAILKTRGVPYVVATRMFLRESDPVVRAIFEDYELVETPHIVGPKQQRMFLLYRRKDRQLPDTAAAPE